MSPKKIIALWTVFCSVAVIIHGGLTANVHSNMAKSDRKKQQPTAKHIEVLLLNALPGSGKSEVRRYLSSLGATRCLQEFGIAPIVQIDDFPYVHMMRRISNELSIRGHEGAFFLSPALTFRDPRDWGTLMHLINEDYSDIIRGKRVSANSVTGWLFNRIDAARVKAGIKRVFKKMPRKLYREIARAVDADAKKLLSDKNNEIDKANGLKVKTVVIEFSRGGADSSPMPLPAPYGYKYAYEQLSRDILEKASILYLWVSPEESRRKNEARANPNDPGSILNHCVPRAVMYSEYGCDDIEWLLSNSGKPGKVSINAHNKTYTIALGRFDNRVDKTTFTHAEESLWKQNSVQILHSALHDAFTSLKC